MERRDPERVERLLELVRTAWERDPDARLLQLLINAAPAQAEPVPGLFYLEDAVLEERLREKLGLAPLTSGPTP